MTPQYQYAAKVRRVIDGDTLELDVDLGFTVRVVVIARLYGINTPETHGPKAKSEKAAGTLATEYVQNWVQKRGEVVVDSYDGRALRQEKYGRWLVRVLELGSGACLNDELVATGHAVAVTY